MMSSWQIIQLSCFLLPLNVSSEPIGSEWNTLRSDYMICCVDLIDNIVFRTIQTSIEIRDQCYAAHRCANNPQILIIHFYLSTEQ